MRCGSGRGEGGGRDLVLHGADVLGEELSEEADAVLPGHVAA